MTTATYRGPIGCEDAGPRANKRRLVIFLTGLTNSGELHSRKLRRVLQKYGAVRWAEYPENSTTRFPGTIVDLLVDEVLGPPYAGNALPKGAEPEFDEVLIVAASLGCLVAGDVCHRLWGRGFKGDIKAILVNPAHRHGFRKLPWRLVFTKPTLEPGIATDQAFRAHMSYMQRLFMRPLWWKQMAYMVRHPLPKNLEFKCVDTVIVRSAPTDPLVHVEAITAFADAYGTRAIRQFTDWHCDFPERPDAWEGHFGEMLPILYPQR